MKIVLVQIVLGSRKAVLIDNIRAQRHVCVPQIEGLSALPETFQSIAESVHGRLYNGLQFSDGTLGKKGVDQSSSNAMFLVQVRRKGSGTDPEHGSIAWWFVDLPPSSRVDFIDEVRVIDVDRPRRDPYNRTCTRITSANVFGGH